MTSPITFAFAAPSLLVRLARRKPSRRALAPSLARWISLATLAALPGCGSGGSVGLIGTGGAVLPTGHGLYFIGDDHFGGQSPHLSIVALYAGRLVDVYDERPDPDQPGGLLHTRRIADLLVPEDLVDDIDFDLSANDFTGIERLTIHHPLGSASFAQSLQRATADLAPFLVRGFADGSDVPPFTSVPRNGAIAVQFNDLLDSSTIDAATLRLEVGSPPAQPFEVRVLPDPSHGGLVDGVFRPTRVLLDLAVSSAEQIASNGAVGVNPLGLPEALSAVDANAVLRVPTQTQIGQFQILRNLSGHGVDVTHSDPIDPTSPTLDVVRSFRSRGRTDVTGDPHNGFLPDHQAPKIVGNFGVTIDAVTGSSQPGESLLDLSFAVDACALSPKSGDVIELPGAIAEIVHPGVLAGNTLGGVRVRAIAGSLAAQSGAVGVLRTTWSPNSQVAPSCFLRFDPLPTSLPDAGASTSNKVIVAFSEPMDPASAQGLETLRLRYDSPDSPQPDNPMWDLVVTRVSPSSDFRTFQVQPVVSLRHAAGQAEVYAFDVMGDDPSTGSLNAPLVEGLTDLAGNGLEYAMDSSQASAGASATFTLEPQQPSIESGGISLRFGNLDEDANGSPELRGQFLIDVARRVLRPRSVSRFSVVLDPNQPVVGWMSPWGQAIVTPLSPYGSKTHALWRHIDMGFSLLDDATHNLDVDGLWWAPFASPHQDLFHKFRIALTHGSLLPDEFTDAQLLPVYPNSGLVDEFVKNDLDPGQHPPVFVTGNSATYLIDPLQKLVTSTGLAVMPFPVHQGQSEADQDNFTYRDTAITSVAGAPLGSGGPGADPERLAQVIGTGMTGFYPTEHVPTIGLPLLMEFRCTPDGSALGLNGFKTSVVLLNSSQPYFRAFSTGGVTNAGTITIDPDQTSIASGGVSPTTGTTTPPLDNVFYHGQVDFVVRTSRLHTIWFDTLTPRQFGVAVVEPTSSGQPFGTSIRVAFRGASFVGAASGTPWLDAANYDPYGNPYTPEQLAMLSSNAAPIDVAYYPPLSGKQWRDNLPELDGARWIQARVSFVSNAQSEHEPTLSALGLGFVE